MLRLWGIFQTFFKVFPHYLGYFFKIFGHFSRFSRVFWVWVPSWSPGHSEGRFWKPKTPKTSPILEAKINIFRIILRSFFNVVLHVVLLPILEDLGTPKGSQIHWKCFKNPLKNQHENRFIILLFFQTLFIDLETAASSKVVVLLQRGFKIHSFGLSFLQHVFSQICSVFRRYFP